SGVTGRRYNQLNYRPESGLGLLAPQARVINVRDQLVESVGHDAKIDRPPPSARPAHHVSDAQAAPLLRLGGALHDGARAERLGARPGSRLRLARARRLHVERAVRRAAGLEASEPFARPAELFLMARASPPLGVDGKLLSAPHGLNDSKRWPAR